MEKFRVKLLTSRAIRNPRNEINKALVFKCRGIVRTEMLVCGMLYEMKIPAKMLSNARHLIGLKRSELFSLIEINGGNRDLAMMIK